MKIAGTLKNASAIVLACAAFFGIYHSFNVYIDNRIQAQLSNPTFLKQLARSIRPAVVFDEQQSILADQGAMEYLTNITIMKEEKDSLVVVVTPKEFIGIEPVLEALDHAYTITAKRGSGYDWVFRLASMNVVVFGGPKETRAQRFRLELIR